MDRKPDCTGSPLTSSLGKKDARTAYGCPSKHEQIKSDSTKHCRLDRMNHPKAHTSAKLVLFSLGVWQESMQLEEKMCEYCNPNMIEADMGKV